MLSGMWWRLRDWRPGEGAATAALLGAGMVVTLAVVVATSSLPSARAQTVGDDDIQSEYFITVTKVLEPSDDPGRFDLFVDDELVFENAGNGDQGGVLSLGETKNNSVTISETLGSETPEGVTLASYSTAIRCVAVPFELSPPVLELDQPTDDSQSLTSPAEEVFTGEGSSLTFEIPSLTDFIDCTITNTRVEPQAPDCDGDGLTDDQEAEFGTEACNPDTDGDGRSDADELFIDGTDPLDPLNLPLPPVAFLPPSCPLPGDFAPPLEPVTGAGTTLTIFGGGTIGMLQDAIADAGYTHATFTFENGLRATIPSDPSDPRFFVFFGGLSDVETTLTVTDTQTSVLRAVEIPPCTPTFLSGDPSLIFADGFESGDVSSWSSIP